LVKPNDRL